MERKNFAQLYINDRYVGVIEIVKETNYSIEFKEMAHGLNVLWFAKSEGIKVINFKNVEV